MKMKMYSRLELGAKLVDTMFAKFYDEHIEHAPEVITRVHEVYGAYLDWCEKEDLPPSTQSCLSVYIARRGGFLKRLIHKYGIGPKWYWLDLKLKDQ
jgi:hypothetical protein